MSKTLLILMLGSLFAVASPINSGQRGTNPYARGQASTQSTGLRQSASSLGVIVRDKGNVWNMPPLLRTRPAQSSWAPSFGSLPAPRDRPLDAEKLGSLRGAGQILPVKQSLNSGQNNSPAQIAAARACSLPSNVEAEKLAKAITEALVDADTKTQPKVQSTLLAKVSPTVVTKVSPTGLQPETSASSLSKGPAQTSSAFEPTTISANVPSAVPLAKMGSDNKPAALDEVDPKHMNSVPGPTPVAGQNNPIVLDEDVPIGGGTRAKGKKDLKIGINIMDSPPDLDKERPSQPSYLQAADEDVPIGGGTKARGKKDLKMGINIMDSPPDLDKEKPSQPSYLQAADEDVPIGGGTKARGKKDLKMGINIIDSPPGFENMDMSEIKSLVRAKPALSGKSIAKQNLDNHGIKPDIDSSAPTTSELEKMLENLVGGS